MFFGKIRENIKKQILEKAELSWKSQGTNSYRKCSTVTLSSWLHSDTITIVPQWQCYHCCTVKLSRLFHSDTVIIVAQWDCCNFSTVTLWELFHNDTVTIVPQWHYCDCSIVTVLRYKFYGLLTLFHSEIHCWRIRTCTRNTTHDPK